MKIELKQVSYKYNEGLAGEVAALKDVDLKVEGPSFIALIGSTGSGKSTLIQLMNGLLKPTSGDILFDGEDLYGRYYAAGLSNDKPASSKTNEKETEISRLKKNKKRKKENPAQKKMLRDIRKRVGIVFQYPESQLFEETVLKDVAFGPKNLGLSPDEAIEKAKKALDDVGISKEQFERSPFELSGGEMRRVAIAGVIAMEPEILILDEPTAGLDPRGKTEILNGIKAIQEKKNSSAKNGGAPMTVLFVSHNMEEVAEYADRVVAMHKGSIIFDGKTRDLFDDPDILKETGLKAPEITYLCKELDIDGVMTIDEAAKSIIGKYKQR